MERFTVGRVCTTPSFSAKPTPEVGHLLKHLDEHKIPTAILRAGDVLSCGEVELEVWHPPAIGPLGPENARSLVIAIRHQDHSIMLTGDLDLEGRARLLAMPRTEVDIWQAPHHGSRTANPPELAAWARPTVVIAHNAKGEAEVAASVYEQAGSRFLGTWPNGAVIITSWDGSLTVKTFRGGPSFELKQLK